MGRTEKQEALETIRSIRENIKKQAPNLRPIISSEEKAVRYLAIELDRLCRATEKAYSELESAIETIDPFSTEYDKLEYIKSALKLESARTQNILAKLPAKYKIN